MIIIAIHGVELNGHIFRKGESCDYNGVVTQRIANNFVDAEGKCLAIAGESEIKAAEKAKEENPADSTKDKVAKAVEVLGRKGIIQQLDTMGITFSPNAKTDYLAKLMLMNKGEIEGV